MEYLGEETGNVLLSSVNGTDLGPERIEQFGQWRGIPGSQRCWGDAEEAGAWRTHRLENWGDCGDQSCREQGQKLRERPLGIRDDHPGTRDSLACAPAKADGGSREVSPSLGRPWRAPNSLCSEVIPCVANATYCRPNILSPLEIERLFFYLDTWQPGIKLIFSSLSCSEYDHVTKFWPVRFKVEMICGSFQKTLKDSWHGPVILCSSVPPSYWS